MHFETFVTVGLMGLFWWTCEITKYSAYLFISAYLPACLSASDCIYLSFSVYLILCLSSSLSVLFCVSYSLPVLFSVCLNLCLSYALSVLFSFWISYSLSYCLSVLFFVCHILCLSFALSVLFSVCFILCLSYSLVSGHMQAIVLAFVVKYSCTAIRLQGPGSNPGQGRNLKTKISASGAPQWWWRRITRAGWGQLRRRYIKPEYLSYPVV